MKPYHVTKHAIERAVERLGATHDQARNLIVQRMQTAVFQGEVPDARIFDHYPSRTRFRLAKDTDTVITVYPMELTKDGAVQLAELSYKPSDDNNVIISKARVLIKRELSKFKRQFTKETRSLTIEHAELHVEIAQLTLNKARAKSPVTQDFIQAKIFALQGRAAAISERLSELTEEYEKAVKQAETFI